MSIWTVKATPENPIPRPVNKSQTTYVIVSMPENLIVTRGTATRSISADLDPGKYRLVVSQMIASGGIGSGRENGAATLMKWKKDFYHEVTPEQHQRIRSAPLRFTRGMMTTEGTRYHCRLTGCENEATSRAAAVLHEAEHSGVDLLAHPMRTDELPLPVVNADAVAADIEAEHQDAINRLRQAALKG